MEFLLSDIEKALDGGLYFIALQSTLTLPDICGYLEHGRNKAVGKRYSDWYRDNMITDVNLSADQCYMFRCKLLHQGLSQYTEDNQEKIVFAYPKCGATIANCSFIEDGKLTISIDLLDFCHDMIKSVRIWQGKVKDNKEIQERYADLIKVHPEGYKNFIVGIPFIG